MKRRKVRLSPSSEPAPTVPSHVISAAPTDIKLRIACGALFVAALVIRALWVGYVQDPADAVVSDMAGYVQRAQALLQGTQTEDRYLAVYPFGTHYLFAAILAIAGHDNLFALTALQVIMSVASVVFIFLTVYRSFSNWAASIAVASALCVWQPWLSFVGYFSSETAYIFFLSMSLWSGVRLLQTGQGAVLWGASSALAFTIRPQMLLFIGLAVIWFAWRRRAYPVLQSKHLLMALMPVVLVVGFSTWRYHHITGDWHVISDNGSIGRFFAGTTYVRMESIERKPDGSAKRRFFQPPATRQIGQTEPFRFYGYIADAQILDAERERFRSSLSFSDKIALLKRNVELLFINNKLWPEMQIGKTPLRLFLLDVFAEVVVWGLLPLALIGLGMSVRKQNPACEIAALHGLTMLYAAILYFGETRYRVPYDAVMMILAAGPVILVSVQLRRRIATLSGRNPTRNPVGPVSQEPTPKAR